MAWSETMPQAEDRTLGIGEARERARFRKRNLVIGAIFAAGLFSGFYVGQAESARIWEGGAGAWSPIVSLVIACVYLIAVIGGSLALQGSLDELERRNAYEATSVASAVFITLYPLWFVLWKGGFVVEPIHWVVFSAFWLTLAAAQLWYRFR